MVNDSTTQIETVLAPIASKTWRTVNIGPGMIFFLVGMWWIVSGRVDPRAIDWYEVVAFVAWVLMVWLTPAVIINGRSGFDGS